MFGNGKSLRPSGVKVASDGGSDLGKPNTIVQVDEAKFYVVHLFDERGRPSQLIAMEVDGVLYTPPNTIEWARSLRQATKWVADGIMQKLALLRKVDVPQNDDVEIMGSNS